MITARNKEALDEAVAAARRSGARSRCGRQGRRRRAPGRDHPPSDSRSFGSVDLLVNNTGINPAYGPIVELDLGAARKVVEVNCIAALSWVQKVHRAWMKEHGGAVVNVSSVSGVRPAPGIGFYGASKAMLVSLTELMALELAPDIRVNAVAPAVVKTRFATALYEGSARTQVAAAYPLKRLGEPEDIGSVVAFLLSDDASLDHRPDSS